ncbi:PRC-barrel domain-containing protein [Loktanella sp. SALINAS62]|uniref:PRC-barrel domain-containing protein n=1 Tax=Loktanella sp. SALINAS62 TaxID=2706124 RepID=UPI001B8B8638|nr:PRC-barrel domain-containing protein [Loktanella sp. SALINAS62]MBS1302936.1 PRC-barrel domain containing protein [Loktanella sp. SALINAS62]
MTRLTTSTLALALAASSAGIAHAETHMMSEPGTYSGVVDNELSNQFIRAESIIGADIHTQYMEYDETAWAETSYYNEIDSDWEEIGEVSDIVISRDGQIVGVIAEVGGWLDIGDADVVIDIADLKTVGGTVDNNFGDLSFVTPLSEEQLESRQEVDSGWW